jgi:hypothetical protein
LRSGITVPDPNPPRVHDAPRGALVNPGEGVVGRVRPLVRLLRRARPRGRQR